MAVALVVITFAFGVIGGGPPGSGTTSTASPALGLPPHSTVSTPAPAPSRARKPCRGRAVRSIARRPCGP
jgi:hypothetical protein